MVENLESFFYFVEGQGFRRIKRIRRMLIFCEIGK